MKKAFYPNRQKTFRLLLVMLLVGVVFLGIDKIGALDWFRALGERYFIIPVKQFVYNLRADNSQNVCTTTDADLALKLQVSQLTEENKQLTKILGLDLPSDWRYLMAKVIESGNDRLTVSLGGNQGVLIGMAAIVGDDRPVYLGQITKVTPNQAEISLVSDYDTRMSVLILDAENSANTVGKGLLLGQGAGQIVVSQILNQEKIQKGDLVVYQHRNQILAVGTINEVVSSDDGIFQTARVTAATMTMRPLTVLLVK